MANKKEKKSEILRLYFANNITKYLQETTLHGLKYLADSSLTIWEKHLITKDVTNNRETEAINWNHENGFPSELPKRYYPMTASDTGISMGVTIILNAELDEYYCSSLNGPGIKVALQNPIEVPFVKETGITVPLGYETRFRINAKYSEAASDLRTMHRNRRQCMFINEENLLYYKYYTINNCEIECHAAYLNKKCGCIPFQYPLIYSNSTVCTVNATNCINNAKRDWTMQLSDELCLKRCLPNCFDLTFLADAFSSRLAESNYLIQNSILQYMNKDQMKNNIAIVHFYYRETVFYGDLKNVYIGFIEFLSNIGGIMGLFMGFSFISVAEIVYFIVLKPFSHFVLFKKT